MSERMFKFAHSRKTIQSTETLPKGTVITTYKIIPFSRLNSITSRFINGEPTGTTFNFENTEYNFPVKDSVESILKMIRSDCDIITFDIVE